MGESHENLLKAIKHYQEALDKHTENRNESKLLHYLERLYKLPVRVVHLEQTGVGRTVNSLRKLGGDVGDSAKALVTKWKDMVVGEQQEEEEDDDEDEDGYQTGEEDDDDDDSEEAEDASSHRKSEAKKDDERKKKEKHKHHKHSSSSKHKSHKRKIEDSSSEDDASRKRARNESSEDEDRHKHSEEEAKKEKKKSRPSEEKARERRSSKDKTHRSSSKKEEHKRSKDKERRSESAKKDSHRSSKEKSNSNKNKSSKSTVTSSNHGIDSGSGASFAEALGMCEPSSSSKTKKKAEKKEKSRSEDAVVPKLLKEPVPEPEPIDIKLESLLPAITPNYRPLGNLISPDSQPKKSISDFEALSNIITSKNQRTKVYSGNKMGAGKVSTLFELCIRVLQDNIDALEYTGGVPYSVLKPILEKSTPNQLYSLEHHNPYLVEDTDELWRLHCQKEFRNTKRDEFESWREMYLRCLDERDAKLKALTANIKQAQDKSLPVRTTKLAYVDAVAKPPRNIARKQAKNGTASDLQRKPAMTPAARLATLATAGEAGKVAVPNPGARAAERANHSHAVKPKKAPLMLKSISSFKNRFKR